MEEPSCMPVRCCGWLHLARLVHGQKWLMSWDGRASLYACALLWLAMFWGGAGSEVVDSGDGRWVVAAHSGSPQLASAGALVHLRPGKSTHVTGPIRPSKGITGPIRPCTLWLLPRGW